MMRRTLPLLLLALGIPTLAAAHPHSRFWVMDDLTPGGYAGADVVFGALDDPFDTEVLLFEPEVAVAVAPAFRLYFELPLGAAFWEPPAPLDDESTGFLGNLTLGGQFISVSGHAPDSQLNFGAGFSFSGLTASNDDESAYGAGAAALFCALRDLGKYRPDTNTIRIHGGLRWALQSFFLQGELGLHFYDDDEDREVFFNDDDVTALRLGLGFGFLVTPELSIQAELTNTSFAFEDDQSDDFYHVIDVGVRHDSGDTTFSVRLVAPLEDDPGFTEALGLGVDFYQRF